MNKSDRNPKFLFNIKASEQKTLELYCLLTDYMQTQILYSSVHTDIILKILFMGSGKLKSARFVKIWRSILFTTTIFFSILCILET